MQYALLSVSDKKNIVALARGLIELGFKIISSGGTAAHLSTQGIPVIEVSEFTGSPEMIGGRVKTLHPRVHGSLLYDRSLPEHCKQAQEYNLKDISIVAVNLYPFKDNIKINPNNAAEERELIDIGGPCLLRAAAKNFEHVLPLCDPEDYKIALHKLRAGNIEFAYRQQLAAKVFAHTSAYDQKIATALAELGSVPGAVELRYGENPHQQGHWMPQAGRPLPFAQLSGKELSYNNLLDVHSVLALISDLSATGQYAAAIVKHNNPCGVALSTSSLNEAYKSAFAGDSQSAFGGIVGLSHPLDLETAQSMHQVFYEVIAAPSFSPEAVELLQSKKNLRMIRYDDLEAWLLGSSTISCLGGRLVQSPDKMEGLGEWMHQCGPPLNTSQLKQLHFAMTVAKHVKSNAIVLASDFKSIGIGAGQMSRIDAMHVAAHKAQLMKHQAKGSYLASDAFFPFADSIESAASLDVSAIVQPGGSVRDPEVIAAAERYGISMYFSGRRHFRHT